ncbi:hypothetical protein SAMN04487947_2198 [Halogeometricum rufum]|uniref:Glycine zipper-like domain-containing protein n=1 Tax=Halogeometricum rufum TaxID=553469 RepID=A0A1I6HL66_9EURY|nr:hypothetical protein [Halogeometricum rufum]SFR55213.1 hypothetical protein SAMN04487947_2198 [Halogeometricum rufum]
MAQELTTQNDAPSGEQSVTEYEPTESHAVGGVSSHIGEKFGVGASAGILLGAVVGVLVAWALGTSTSVAFLIVLGTGFILAPVIGLLYMERSD